MSHIRGYSRLEKELIAALREAEAGLECAGADKQFKDGDFVPSPTLALWCIRKVFKDNRIRIKRKREDSLPADSPLLAPKN